MKKSNKRTGMCELCSYVWSSALNGAIADLRWLKHQRWEQLILIFNAFFVIQKNAPPHMLNHFCIRLCESSEPEMAFNLNPVILWL